MSETRALDSGTAKRIAGAFSPERWLGDRTHYFYALTKLRTDPLYPGVIEVLRGTSAPLLDLGCGIGLLAHALRDAGIDLPYRGVDNDAPKIASAQRGAANAGLDDVAFDCVDVSAGIPAHRGSVAILDVLQFLTTEQQDVAIDTVIAMLTPGARLVIRTGLDDGSARARTTRRIDHLSRVVGWMKSTPRHYPDPDALHARFDAAGLASEFTPLHAGTPFNNWRIVATKPA
jgi:2-polyprenyl-3-methyl-5-hydroxy-6-metoxy-1,4-benzoquinol methylase